MAADTLQQEALHETSLAVWDIPTAVAGERFAVKIGAKSSSGCAMGGCRIEVLDGAGAVAASGRLSETPWPDTDALFWTEVELRASPEPGPAGFSVRFDAADLDATHQSATLAFNVPVVVRPQHTVTVNVAADGRPLEEAIVRLGPYRAMTDAAGIATVKTANGRYELIVWKAGYDAPVTPLTIDADAVVAVNARTLPEDDPDFALDGVTGLMVFHVMSDTPPDRLCNDPRSPYYDADVLARDVGIRFKGAEKTNVEEYCVSEGWIRVAAGKALDRYGSPLTIKLTGTVEPYFKDQKSEG